MQKGQAWMYRQYKLDEWGQKTPCLKNGIHLEKKKLRKNDSQPCFRKASHPPWWLPVTVSMREGKTAFSFQAKGAT